MKKLFVYILFAFATVIGMLLPFRSESQPRRAVAPNRVYGAPAIQGVPRAAGIPGAPGIQPGYRVGVPGVSPNIPGVVPYNRNFPVVPMQPQAVPLDRIVSLQLAITHLRPLDIYVWDAIFQPDRYYGRYVKWNGLVMEDQKIRYMANIPDKSGFYFSIVNPSLQSKKFAKNQQVTVVGKIGRIERPRTVLGIEKRFPIVEASYVE